MTITSPVLRVFVALLGAVYVAFALFLPAYTVEFETLPSWHRYIAKKRDALGTGPNVVDRVVLVLAIGHVIVLGALWPFVVLVWCAGYGREK